MTEIEKLEALSIGQNIQKDIQAFNGDVVSLELLERHIQNDNQVGMMLELISLNRYLTLELKSELEKKSII